MFEKTGIPSKEMIMEKFPSIERINKGPVAVVECYREIPCNPCETACKFHAINIGADINTIPVVTSDNCTGCSMCLTRCPGLSIMLVDGSKSPASIHFKLPYEFIPLPEAGDIVKGLDREGKYITDCKVISVQNPKSFDRTPLVTVEADRKFLYELRNIRVEARQ